jgi:hypothetical protein
VTDGRESEPTLGRLRRIEVPSICSFPRTQPQKTCAPREGLSAEHLTEVHNALQSPHRTWDRGRRATFCALVVCFSFAWDILPQSTEMDPGSDSRPTSHLITRQHTCQPNRSLRRKDLNTVPCSELCKSYAFSGRIWPRFDSCQSLQRKAVGAGRGRYKGSEAGRVGVLR